MKTIQELESEVNALIELVKKGFKTSYISYTDADGVIWKIRVSDHRANPLRSDENTISFIVKSEEEPLNDDEDDAEVYPSFSINKKRFRDIPNQYVIIDGVDADFGDSIFEILSKHLN